MVVLTTVVGTSLVGCSVGSPAAGRTSMTSVASASASTSPARTSTSAASTSATPTTSMTRSSAATVAPALACARRIVGRMTPGQKVGQLVWPALGAGAGASGLDRTIRDHHLGGIFYLGGWTGSATVAQASRHLQTLAASADGHRVGLFVAADQEGGQVQQLRGAGFTALPSARAQDARSPAQQQAAWKAWARQLAAAGVNLDLAPVADTVPAGLGTRNGPIGRYDRQFSSDPVDNARMVAASVKGMHAGGIGSTVKHFPGLGRIRQNTDVSATGITDTVTTTHDAYLAPFAAGIEAGSDVVMVGSAIYSKIDPSTNAVFSRRIVTDLLRDQMGYAGVVMSDDLGAAVSVSAVPVGSRATRFIAAGGDVILTAKPSTVSAMTAALTQRYGSSAAFKDQVDASATRVLTLKVDRGLATCS